MQNILVANAKMSDEVAYDIVKTLFEKRDDLVAVHEEAASIDAREPEARTSPIPWHPGAAKYLRRKGREDVSARARRRLDNANGPASRGRFVFSKSFTMRSAPTYRRLHTDGRSVNAIATMIRQFYAVLRDLLARQDECCVCGFVGRVA